MFGRSWRGKVVEGGLEGEAHPHDGEAASASRHNCLVAGDAVSVISSQRPRLMYRNFYRPPTRLLPMLSLSSQLLSDEERRSWRFRSERNPMAVAPNVTGVYTLPVVSPTRGNSRILEAGRRRPAPGSCRSLAKDGARRRLCP